MRYTRRESAGLPSGGGEMITMAQEPPPYNPVPVAHTCPYCHHVTHSLNRTLIRCARCHFTYEVYRGQADHVLKFLREKGPLTINELIDLVDGTTLTVQGHRNAQGRMDRLLRKAEHFKMIEQIRPSRGGKWRVRE